MSDSEFRKAMMELLISENGYVLDTGTQYDVNTEVIARIREKIAKHPKLWRLFFMVA